jgi:hypothetical protein
MEDRAQDLERQNEQLRRQMNQKELIISKLSKEYPLLHFLLPQFAFEI